MCFNPKSSIDTIVFKISEDILIAHTLCTEGKEIICQTRKVRFRACQSLSGRWVLGFGSFVAKFFLPTIEIIPTILCVCVCVCVSE